MKYIFFFLLIVLAACSDDEPECDVQPEAFRFKLIDQAGNNQFTADERPSKIRIFFFEDGREVSIEVFYEGNNQDVYGSSPVVPYSSIYGNIETFYLERDTNVDTLLVRASERSPGNKCAGYSYDTVTFNGIPATLDNTVEPPVYVLVEK